MNNNLNIDKSGLEFIKKWEGCVLKVYRDVANLKTVGVGHLITKDEDELFPDGMVITEEKAIELLNEDVQKCVVAIKKDIKVELNQNQFNALCSFGFNCGTGVYTKSSACIALNEGDVDTFCVKLLEWSRAKINGVYKTIPGLLNRRKSEVELFNKAVSESLEDVFNASVDLNSYSVLAHNDK